MVPETSHKNQKEKQFLSQYLEISPNTIVAKSPVWFHTKNFIMELENSANPQWGHSYIWESQQKSENMICNTQTTYPTLRNNRSCIISYVESLHPRNFPFSIVSSSKSQAFSFTMGRIIFQWGQQLNQQSEIFLLHDAELQLQAPEMLLCDLWHLWVMENFALRGERSWALNIINNICVFM